MVAVGPSVTVLLVAIFSGILQAFPLFDGEVDKLPLLDAGQRERPPPDGVVGLNPPVPAEMPPPTFLAAEEGKPIVPLEDGRPPPAVNEFTLLAGVPGGRDMAEGGSTPLVSGEREGMNSFKPAEISLHNPLIADGDKLILPGDRETVNPSDTAGIPPHTVLVAEERQPPVPESGERQPHDPEVVSDPSHQGSPDNQDLHLHKDPQIGDQPRILSPGPIQPAEDQPNNNPPVPIEPLMNQPNIHSPGPIQPPADQPNNLPPGPIQPSGNQPNNLPPGLIQPLRDQPNIPQPGPIQPSGDQPDIPQPGPIQPSGDQPNIPQPGLIQPSGDQPNILQPGPIQPSGDQPNIPQPGHIQPSGDQPNNIPQPGPIHPSENQPNILQSGPIQPSGDQPRIFPPEPIQPASEQRVEGRCPPIPYGSAQVPDQDTSKSNEGSISLGDNQVPPSLVVENQDQNESAIAKVEPLPLM